jgi:hypothetical protein
MVQPRDNGTSPFTAYALKLGETGHGHQFDEWNSPIITSQVTELNSMVRAAPYHGTGHGTLFDGCYYPIITAQVTDANSMVATVPLSRHRIRKSIRCMQHPLIPPVRRTALRHPYNVSD